MEHFKDFYNIVKLKYELITKSEEEIKTQLQDEKKLTLFLETVELLLKKEEAFLFLSNNFITKINNIVSNQRFVLNDTTIISKLNEVIAKLNELAVLPNNLKRVKALNYIDYQNEIRHIQYDDLKNFLGAMAMDYEVLKTLLNDDTASFPHDEIFLSSTNYFLEVEPAVYENREIRYLTKEKIDAIKKKKYSFQNRYIKKYANLTAFNFKNLWY